MNWLTAPVSIEATAVVGFLGVLTGSVIAGTWIISSILRDIRDELRRRP